MVSLELVGEVFEVRTQVDRDFTTVSRVDHRLGLIENLGRHTIWIFLTSCTLFHPVVYVFPILIQLLSSNVGRV
jgi:hypothetical protein